MALVHPNIVSIETFEDVLSETGWGIYYKFLLTYTSISCFAKAITSLIIPFGILTTVCDSNTGHDMFHMNIFLMLGNAIGGLVLCSLGDGFEKKSVLTQSCVLIFGASFLTAFSHDTHTLLCTAFVLGSGLQANHVCTKINFAEILPQSKRGFYIILPDLFWTVGYLLTALIACFSVSQTAKEFKWIDMKITIWRVMFIITGGLYFILACASALVEYSPRYLLFRKENQLALLLLKQFYGINKVRYIETFEPKAEQLNNLIFDYNLTTGLREPITLCEHCITLTKIIFKMYTLLLRKRFVITLLCLIAMKISMLFGIVGINFSLVKTLLYKDNCTLNSIDILNFNLPQGPRCTIPANYRTLYEFFLILSINIFLGQIISMLTVDKFGRLAVTGFLSFLLAFITHFVIRLIASSILLIAFSNVESVLGVVVIESFPTAIRGTASGKVNFYSFMIICILSVYFNLPCHNFFVIIGTLTIGTSVLAYFLPNLKGHPMIE